MEGGQSKVAPYLNLPAYRGSNLKLVISVPVGTQIRISYGKSQMLMCGEASPVLSCCVGMLTLQSCSKGFNGKTHPLSNTRIHNNDSVVSMT